MFTETELSLRQTQDTSRFPRELPVAHAHDTRPSHFLEIRTRGAVANFQKACAAKLHRGAPGIISFLVVSIGSIAQPRPRFSVLTAARTRPRCRQTSLIFVPRMHPNLRPLFIRTGARQNKRDHFLNLLRRPRKSLVMSRDVPSMMASANQQSRDSMQAWIRVLMSC